ncbi:substance-P receptor-like [Haliotis asinina]|uniref:substance-P receptor-like n=1 Tax=Haliotis asinina TaxID=109174 RepID=UPI003531A8E5
MENTTTDVDYFHNSTEDSFITTELPTTTPKSPYPPGYFVIPAEHLIIFRLAIYTIITPVTVLIGLVGNGISFVVLLRNKMRGTTKMILLSITACDFLHLIGTTLSSLVGLTISLDYKPGVDILRKAFPYFYFQIFVFGDISNVLIVVISLERLCAVILPLKVKSLWSKKTMGISIFICSLLAIVLLIPSSLEYIPAVLSTNSSTQASTSLTLTEFGKKHREFYAALNGVRMSLIRFIPVIVVTISTIAISVGLYRAKSSRSMMTDQNHDESSAEQRITQTLLGLTLLYFFCMTPGAFVIFISSFSFGSNLLYTRTNVYTLVGILTNWLAVLNSSVNFIVYIVSNQQMRGEFKRVISCCLIKKRPNRKNTSVTCTSDTNTS